MPDELLDSYDRLELPEVGMMTAFFSMELIFKSLEARRGSYLVKHSLSELFEVLPEDEKNCLRNAYAATPTMWDKTLDEFLERNSDSFVQRRYEHEGQKPPIFLSSHLALSLWEAASQLFPEARYRLPI